MTDLYLARKIANPPLCVRCGCELAEDTTSVLCDEHRLEAAARIRAHLAKKRAERRDQGECAGCGVPSCSYWCSACAQRRKGGSVEAAA